MGVKGKQREYSDVERANGLAALAANGGNVAMTARQLGVPRQTLQRWIKPTDNEHVLRLRHEKKRDMADELERVAWLIIDSLPSKIKKAPLSQASTSMGIAIDKFRLLRNEPTSIGTMTTDNEPLDIEWDLLTRDERDILRKAVERTKRRHADSGVPSGPDGLPGQPLEVCSESVDDPEPG
jgi:hypothetical protein